MSFSPVPTYCLFLCQKRLSFIKDVWFGVYPYLFSNIFFLLMAGNFSKQIIFDGKTVLAVFVPQFRTDGMHYEVNIKNYPRFYMAWSPLDRYDVVKAEGLNLPYALILAASDAIEQQVNSH